MEPAVRDLETVCRLGSVDRLALMGSHKGCGCNFLSPCATPAREPSDPPWRVFAGLEKREGVAVKNRGTAGASERLVRMDWGKIFLVF